MVAVDAVIEKSRSVYDSVAIAASNFADDINFYVESSLSINFKFTARTISVIVVLYNRRSAVQYRIRSMEMQPVDIILMNGKCKHSPFKM